jgi:hypothetical protein
MNPNDIWNCIHLACSGDFIGRITRSCTERGGTSFELDLQGAQSKEALVDQFIDVFRIPYPMEGVDAVISLGSDLDWLENRDCFAVIVTSVDESPEEVIALLALVFTRIIDRMRTAGDRYAVFFPPARETDRLLQVLEYENERLRYLERIDPDSDTHPVPVIDHRLDPPAGA